MASVLCEHSSNGQRAVHADIFENEVLKNASPRVVPPDATGIAHRFLTFRWLLVVCVSFSDKKKESDGAAVVNVRSLTCAVVNEVGDVLGVEMDDAQPMWKLRDAIADAIKYCGRANTLRLYVAKTESGQFLLETSDAAQQLEQGTRPPPADISKMLESSHKMMAAWTLDQVLSEFHMTGDNAPRSQQVHVLVVAPEVLTGYTPSLGSKYHSRFTA